MSASSRYRNVDHEGSSPSVRLMSLGHLALSTPHIAALYRLGYNGRVFEIRQTGVYTQWFAGLRDRRARTRIDMRIRRLSLGNPGDAKSVGDGVSELRIDYGPGYRVYFTRRGGEIVILLAGGDKRTQTRDIRTARELARNL